MNECRSDDCRAEISNKKQGLCRPHYVEFLESERAACCVDGCPRKAQVADPMCSAHKRKVAKWGSLESAPGKGAPGKARKSSQTGRRSHSGGYMLVQMPDRTWKLEHRAVMETILGRELLAWENVHHKNADRTDNRPMNLELWISRQPTGARVEDAVAWAREILDLYDSVS